MNISGAIELMREGRFVARQDWGHRVYVFMRPHVDYFTYSHNGSDTVWVPPHLDLLADDWQEVIPHP
jgi:hypothetical protein